MFKKFYNTINLKYTNFGANPSILGDRTSKYLFLPETLGLDSLTTVSNVVPWKYHDNYFPQICILDNAPFDLKIAGVEL